MNSRIGIIKDKSDLIINLTNDNIINVTGMIGSGKTTLGKKINEDKNIEIVSLDWLFGYSTANRPDKINKMIKEIEDIYIETKNQNIFKYVYKTRQDKKIEKNYYKYASKIYKYLLQKYKNQPIIIEGRHIYKYINLEYIKGTIIIKRTSLFHSYKRAFDRDFMKSWKMYKSGKIEIKEVRTNFFKRIKIPLKDYIQANRFIKNAISINNLFDKNNN